MRKTSMAYRILKSTEKNSVFTMPVAKKSFKQKSHLLTSRMFDGSVMRVARKLYNEGYLKRATAGKYYLTSLGKKTVK